MKAYEVNFDGLVGSTHNYAGLSYGNLASCDNRLQSSNPKLAALQGLAKMKALHELGLIQGVLPPQERPDLNTLRKLGFTGSNVQILTKAAKEAPEILASCSSASSMWTANAATISPSADTGDGRVHITPANLASKLHRSIEHETTGKILKRIFHDDRYFVHHSVIPSIIQLGDEGAANHTRFCGDYNAQGVELFVFGCYGFNNKNNSPVAKLFPARQTFEASAAVARSHLLNVDKVVYAQQNPDVIDQGVFHNDVIAVGNKNTLFCHEKAFLNQTFVYKQLQQACDNVDLAIVEVPDDRVSISDAVSSYLFNSQLLSVGDKSILIVPSESHRNENVSSYLADLVSANASITDTMTFDLRQSMKNGGGPACLRLRVVMTEQELASVNQACIFNNDLYLQLHTWINEFYRDRLTEQDLADPQLLDESRASLENLTRILKLGAIYDFQN
ncbi:MAG: N-succinylarginine dihydrolase [Candidatus Endonucleobacter sp. (ex Gigantidas childressi)]|nr:N-succinylarginine dihydrolase [Candidatus Endonucleobacter sp. (ex Gigantidas childressi)]